ncbi:MAG: acetolactate synthase large subunit, acetolactate synthase I/II/III large subunit [Chloroflexi bacterium CSP1-4]|nr:MAG: acetolactate synthase large subunit, acetolactate synthase I/II/III large subunit [Chloroflexi bacterium CSP1-4]
MTMTRRQSGRHVPAAGTPAAAAVERARSAMFHEAKPRGRTRIGADVVCEALLRQGADVLFGYPGGVILPLYDVFGDYPDLRHILVRHEQGAAHAADGYARATGRVGVCMGTSGPGATNLVTGLATAQLDSIPVVAITGNVPAALIGKDAFQEIDINGITLPMTKHNYLVRNADDLPRVLAEAFYIARTGRPGPVHVDITKDALQQETLAPHPSDDEVAAGLPGFKPNFDGHPRQLKVAAREIDHAQRPVILAGHGILIAEAWDDLRAFAEKAQIPVAHTLLGIGAMDETHPLSYGYMGMHGWKHVNKAIQSADLLIALGMRFDDRVTGKVSTYAPGARIIHVDIDPSEIGKNVAVDVPIVGDVGRVLRALLPLVKERRAEDRAAFFAELAEWRRESEGSSWHGSGAWRDGLLSADFVVARIGELTDHDATLVADVGQNQMWLARYAGFRRPNSHLSSAGLGTMGYSMPAGMGAALGRPDKETWAIAGDGGFQMTLQELATLVQDRIPVRIALLDNKKLGMIRQWQEIVYAGNYHSASLFGPDYLKLCEAYGIPAWKASKPEEVDGAIQAAQAVDGPALVWFEIAEEQNVFPMMPAGKGLSDLIEKWGGADE